MKIEFIAFLLSDLGQNLMTNNSLSIHIESGCIFYFNTNENFYNFLIGQQNDQTAPVPKRFSYHHSFEQKPFTPDNFRKYNKKQTLSMSILQF